MLLTADLHNFAHQILHCLAYQWLLYLRLIFIQLPDYGIHIITSKKISILFLDQRVEVILVKRIRKPGDSRILEGAFTVFMESGFIERVDNALLNCENEIIISVDI